MSASSVLIVHNIELLNFNNTDMDMDCILFQSIQFFLAAFFPPCSHSFTIPADHLFHLLTHISAVQFLHPIKISSVRVADIGYLSNKSPYKDAASLINYLWQYSPLLPPPPHPYSDHLQGPLFLRPTTSNTHERRHLAHECGERERESGKRRGRGVMTDGGKERDRSREVEEMEMGDLQVFKWKGEE